MACSNIQIRCAPRRKGESPTRSTTRERDDTMTEIKEPNCGEVIDIKLPHADSTELVYLASPYSHPDEKVRINRYKSACRAAAILFDAGYNVFSPIAHAHGIAKYGRLDGGWDTWKRFDRIMLAACSHVFVYCLPGYDESHGITNELRIARAMNKPITMMQTYELKITKMMGEKNYGSYKEAHLPR